ncbi:MAG: ABC transporter ATP-binding protein [Actinomycetota bacterium]
MGMHGGGGGIWGPGAGGGGGGMFSGGPRTSAAAGLPFAGIPPELHDLAQKILDTEPEHGEEHVTFERIEKDKRPFTLRRFFAPHKWWLAGSFLFVVIETVALQAGGRLTAIAVDRGIMRGSFRVITIVAIIYMATVLFGGVAGRIRLAWTGRVGQRLMFHLRVRIFAHLQRLGLDFYTREKAGRLMTRMTSDVEALHQLFNEGLVNLIVQALQLLVVTVVLFTMNVRLAAFTVGFVLPVMTVTTMWFRSVSDRGFLAVRDRIADVLADLQESLSGVRIVAAHNRQRHNVVRHRNILGEHRDANRYTAKAGSLYGPGTEAIGIIGNALILLVGGPMVVRGSLGIGELVAFVLYLSTFFAPIQTLVQLYNTYQQGGAAVKKLRDLFAEEPDPAEAPDAFDLPPIDGDIVLDGVTFGYDVRRPVLRDVDLHIAPGETFALVGPTGAGKSTIVKLIARLYDPISGRILVDGHDIARVTQTSLRSQIGNVPQEPFLFAGSIRDNIAFARPTATEEEIVEACRAVGIMDLIERLPDGLDTPCHERGVSLSSGERQLLALARAFLARPRVLILDEATSSLDLQSESKIEGALDVLLEGRTAIIIAHRLSTAMRAQRLGVVEDGRIVELGSHDELVALGGRYAHMYETWMSHAQPVG